ncbi:MAG: pentapeptide repeat-containing protein [Xanthomonadaceae bacterium]|nr:pentapeptide repeat-containing protein [Xanthomonadaceae bacterium]MDP2185571.1 pentapeptide repeat-containing protein [Xanthomonadales bacterium]MDZ4114627.1 pentapeptide repeat-containing protein [Xanthomonadaceae bacterium]
MKPAELKSRWPPRCRSDISPFGMTAERLKDFRGIPFPQAVKDRKFSESDFSFLDAQGTWIESCVFERCVFRKGDFKNFHDHRNVFVDCQFVECNFSGAALGFFTSRYECCVFEKCRFTRTIFSNAVFKHTKFLDVKIRDIDFNASGFWDCKITGVLNDVWFKGTYQFPELEQHVPVESGLHNVNFEAASLGWITVSNGCVLEDLALPNDAALLDVAHLLRDFESSVGQYFDHNERSKIQRYLEIHPHIKNDQVRTIVTLTELVESYGEPLAARFFDHLVSEFGVRDDGKPMRQGVISASTGKG